MPIIKSKSKYDSSCAYEKDGMKCSNQIKVGDDYLYDTDIKKAYCTKHDELNEKATEPQSGGSKGGGSRYTPPKTFRDPEEGLRACQYFNESVVPMIRKQSESDPATIKFWTEVYTTIFMGKYPPKNGEDRQ